MKNKITFFNKKLITLLLVLSFLFCSFGCSNSEELKVKFISSEQTKTVSVNKGDIISSNSIPSASKEGYTFNYWSIDGVSAFDFNTSITSNISLTPIFTANEYTLSFEGLTQNKTVTFDSAIGDLPDFTNPNTIDYWSIDGVKISENTIWNFTEDKTANKNSTYYVSLDSFDGTSISLIPTSVSLYLSKEKESDIAKYLYKSYQSNVKVSGPKPINFSWKKNVEQSLNYTLLISSDIDFNNIDYSLDTTYTSATVYNLIPNKYYWKVVCSNGAESEVDSFVISDTLRAIDCGGIANMRDIGGYTSEFGKVKYGLAYRSTDPSTATETAKNILVNQLKIKTQIDLRTDKTVTSPDPSITYVKAGFWQNDYIFPNFNSKRAFSQTYANGIKTALLKFTDISNYPIVFHCTSGADRTGTFAFLLGGLLGVSYKDLVSDFELTAFFGVTRWRSDIKISNGVYYFDESGVMQDDSSNLVAFQKMYNRMMSAYGTGDSKLSSAVVNYLKTVVGLSDKNISDIRANMLITL